MSSRSSVSNISSIKDMEGDDDYVQLRATQIDAVAENQDFIQKNMRAEFFKTIKKKQVKDLAAIRTASMDTRHKTTEDDVRKIVKAEENMKDFMNNYSQTFEIPSFYVENSKFYGRDPNYYFQIVHYKFPEKMMVFDHAFDQHEKKEFKDVYKFKPGAYLVLMKLADGNIKKEGEEIYLGNSSDQHMIKFSHDWKQFALFNHKKEKNETTIKLFTFSNPDELFQKIKNDDEKDGYDKIFTTAVDGITGQDFTDVEFDNNTNFLVCYGKTTVYVINLKRDDIQKFELDQIIYEKIFHLRIVSTDEFTYKCHVAAKKKDLKQVCLFDINDEFFQINSPRKQPRMERTSSIQFKNMMAQEDELEKERQSKIDNLNFSFEPTELTKVHISYDLKQVAFCNDNENFIMIKKEDHVIQKGLPQLQHKVVHHIQFDMDTKEFLFICFYSYDDSMDIQSSRRNDFEIAILREIEPGMNTIHDMQIITQKLSDGSTSKTIYVASLKDMDFIYDVIDYKQKEKFKGMEGSINLFYELFDISPKKYVSVPIKAFSHCWPYVAFSGLKKNALFVVSAFNQDYIHRIRIKKIDKESNFYILQTWITNSLDLMIFTKDNDEYQLFKINLDDCNQFEIDHETFDQENFFRVYEIIKFNASMVGNQEFKSFHARGSSKKELIDTNTNLVVFFIFGENLYSWTEFIEKYPHDQKDVILENWGGIHSNIRLEEKSIFYYLQNTYDNNEHKTKILHQEIKKLKVGFSFCQVQTVYKNSSKDVIKSINFDKNQNKLIIFSQLYNEEDLNQKKSQFSIFDVIKQKIIYKKIITFRPMIGRLEQGMYTLSDGYIYYNNHIIKIRYDLIDRQDGDKYRENEIFDYYFDIFVLAPGEKAISGTPIDSYRDHKMAYIISDKVNYGITKIFYVPYLHDKKIYLNRQKLNTEYFYTSMETPIDGGPETEQWNNKFLKLFGLDKPKEQHTLSAIFSVNLTEHKIYVYSQRGILFNRYCFKKCVHLYGEINATSCCGHHFIFKKTPQQMRKQLSTDEKDFWQFHVISMSVFGPRYVKTIDILQQYRKLGDITWIDQIKQDANGSSLKLHEKIRAKILINANLDICIQLSYKKDHYNLSEQDQRNETIYLFMAWDDDNFDCKKIDPKVLGRMSDQEKENFFRYFDAKKKNPLKNYQFIEHKKLFSHDHGWFHSHHDDEMKSLISKERRKFMMNKKYLFIYDHKEIWHFDLTGEQFKLMDGPKKIEFKVDNSKGTDQFIKKVSAGVNPEKIIIILDASKEQDTIFEWDLINNVEEQSTDVGKNYEICWDNCGNPLILTPTEAIIDGRILKTFDLDEEVIASPVNRLSKYTGHRLDGKNWNWFVIKQFISLPFSYISFVIKDKIEKKDKYQVGNIFDVTPFNYIYNKKSCFLDSDIVYSNSHYLQNVLENLKQMDVTYLDLLCTFVEYKDKDGNVQFISPLSRAVDSGNIRTINLLLKYMSYCRNDFSGRIKSLFPQLLEFNAFHDYLTSLPVETIQMKEKENLHVNSSLNNSIVCMIDSPTRYVDDLWFQQRMGEDKVNIKSAYPVDVKGMKIRWFIRDKQGKDFFDALLYNNDLSLYNITTLEMIIEYLYLNYKNFLYNRNLPLFVLRLTFFYTAMFTNEFTGDATAKGNVLMKKVLQTCFYSQCVLEVYALIVLKSQLSNRTLSLNTIVNIMLFFCFLFNILGGLVKIEKRFHGTMHFAAEKHLYISEEFGNFLLHHNRINNCVVIFLLNQQCLGFLQLNDNISPFIDIFYQIFADIKYFMLVLLIFGFSCANCFWLLSKNQLQFDNLTSQDIDKIAYGTLTSAGWYIWQMVLGNGDDSAFELGLGTQQYYLKFLFSISAFVMVFHLMNMLIAIMGNTFAVRSEIAKEIRIRDHLRFVVDNWYLSDYAFKNKDRLKFIVTAFIASETTTQNNEIDALKDKVKSLDEKMDQILLKLEGK